MDQETTPPEIPENTKLAVATPVAEPAEPAWQTTARKLEQRRMSEMVSSSLRIDECLFVIMDENGGIERKALDKEMALDFAKDRVDHAGGIKVVFQRIAVVRVRSTTDEISVE